MNKSENVKCKVVFTAHFTKQTLYEAQSDVCDHLAVMSSVFMLVKSDSCSSFRPWNATWMTVTLHFSMSEVVLSAAKHPAYPEMGRRGGARCSTAEHGGAEAE